jgi:hypothetical protein
VADWANATLLADLAVQQLAHLGRRSQFPVPSRVMGIFNFLNSESDQLGSGERFPTTAGKRLVNRAQFIATESHGIPLGDWLKSEWVGDGTAAPQSALLQFLSEEDQMSKLAKLVQQLQKERDQAQGRVKQLDEALKALGKISTPLGATKRQRRARTSGKRQPMSAAARRRIAAAQRARWAKWRAARKRS